LILEGILLVDGYNVLNSWPELARLKEEDLGHARDRLIAVLSEFQALCGLRIILVFDAHQVKGMTGHQEECQGIGVVYTREGETADEWIERYVAQHRQKGEVIPLFVTTSDWLEQRIVAAQGAYRVTPRELYQEYQRLKKESETCLRGKEPNFTPLDSHLPEKTRELLEKWRRQKF